MNTRQKLTLGIAAIFMVTLTIIGVTYAYFVTRVEVETTATAVINTATIGTAYQDNNQNVVVDNVLPGEVVYKTFVVNNKSEVPVGFAVTIASKRNTSDTVGTCSVGDGTYKTKAECTAEGVNGTWTGENLPAFTHSTLAADYTARTGDLIETCFKGNAFQTQPANCYNATTYDNILVELYRIENYTQGLGSFINDSTANGYNSANALNLQNTPEVFEEWKTCSYNADGTVNYESCKAEEGESEVKKIPVTTDATYKAIQLEAPYCDATDAVCNPTGIHQKNSTVLEQVAAGTNQSNYYVLKVTYVNRNVNQNIENDASVSLKVDINANTIPSVAQNAALPVSGE